MEIRRIFEHLARHRGLALAGLLPALLVGVFVAFDVSRQGIASRAASSTTTSVQVLLQTRDYPPDDLDPAASNGNSARARLVGELMATDAVRLDIARGAGVPPDDLSVSTPTSGTVEIPVPIALEGSALSAPRSPYVLAVSADGIVPILTLKVTAPSREGARRVVTAAKGSLERLVVGNPASRPGLTVRTLGAPTTKVARTSSKLPAGVAAAIVAFGLWCAAVVVATGLGHPEGGSDPRRGAVGGVSA